MKAHEKTNILGMRRDEAMKTARAREIATCEAYEDAKRARFSARFLIVWAIARAKERRARKAYEIAQEQKLTIARQYAAILAAVPVDYHEPNTATA